MKSFIKMVFAGTIGTFIGFALIIFLGLATLILISSFTASQFGNAKIEPNSVLFLPLRGELVERKGNMFLDWEEDSPFYRGPRHVGLWEIERALEKAQSDSRIRGVYIKMDPTIESLLQHQAQYFNRFVQALDSHQLDSISALKEKTLS